MCFLGCSEIHASSKLLIYILDFPWAGIEEELDFAWLAKWLSKEERSVEITNPSMDEKLDSSEQQVCAGFDVTKSGYKAVIGDMICAAICHSQMKNAMETPKRKRGTKRVITLEDLQPHFGRRTRADAAKILGGTLLNSKALLTLRILFL